MLKKGVVLPVLLLGAVIGIFLVLLLGLFAASQGNGGTPLGAGNGNGEIAFYAQEMAAHLRPGGVDGFDVVMDSSFPQPALDFWDQICGWVGCGRSLSGTLQCGQFVAMAYGWAGLRLVGASVVLDWWNAYASGKQPGWTEIPNGASLPQPGDILLFATPPGPFAGEGHAGVVVSVQPPVNSESGSIVFAEANGPTPLVTMPLTPQGVEVTWSGYTVLGVIRHLSPAGGNKTALITIRHDQLDPAEYDPTGFFSWATWAYSACSAGALTNVIDGYGFGYRIADILRVEYRLGMITPQLGLVEEAGIARTAAQFGFRDFSTMSYSLEQIVAVAQGGHPVIVDFPPSKFAGGHLLVVVGGVLGTNGLVETVNVVDSGFDRSSIDRSQFLQWWGGQSDILFPQVS